MAEIHRDHPGYLQSSVPDAEAALPAELAPRWPISKVAYEELAPPAAAPATSVHQAGSSQAEPLRLTAPRKSVPIRAVADVPHEILPVRSTHLVAVAQDRQPSQADEVFGDALDDLLPGDQTASPESADVTADDQPPAGDDDLPFALPADDAAELPEMPASPGAATPSQQTPEDNVIDAPPAELPGTPSVDEIFGDDALPESDPSQVEATPLPDEEEAPSPGPSPSRTAPQPEQLQPTPAERSPAPRAVPRMPAEDAGMPRPRDAMDGALDEYNGRDCAAEQMSLQAAWEELRQTPINSITLDISPSIEPNESREVVERSRLEMLGRAPSRVWRSPDGRVVARGKMVDFKNGKLIINDESGQQQKVSWYDLSNDDLCFVTAWWELPSEYIPPAGTYAVRNWTMITFTWKASGLCHKPLYFEEVALERYGHSAEPVTQTFLSGAHFFGNIFFLPYHIGLNPPNECQYALGYYRPGSCAPWMLPAVPLDARAFRMQVGALAGGLALLP
jgi:hypothetical protein